MPDLMLSWLRAQIQADLDAAEGASTVKDDGSWSPYRDWSDFGGTWVEPWDQEHIQRQDPPSTIARCEAELRELDRHEPNFADCCPLDDEVSPCESVQIMASGYRHRPGWSLSWSPDTTEGTGS